MPVLRALPWLVALFVASVVALPRAAWAGTPIAGGNLVTQTWTASNSPYTVLGDVTVLAGQTLTVEAGVTVEFATNADSQGAGRSTTQAELVVAGTLKIQGTAQSPVILKSQAGTAANQWYGVLLTSTSTSSTIDYATIQNAQYGVLYEAAGTNLAMKGGTITTNATGIGVAAGTPTFEGVTVTANTSYGAYLSGTGGGTFKGCVFSANSSYGVYVASSGAGVATTFTNITITRHSSYGIYANTGAHAITVTNSIIASNGSYGIYKSAAPNVVVTNTDIWGQSTATSGSVNTTYFSANPLFVSATDVTLTSNSPARFAGDDGNDVGAKPYAGQATAGLYGTLWSTTTLGVSGSPYTVDGDLTVPAGKTLTLDPGVTLNFGTGDVMAGGANTSKAELRVLGTLVANGTKAAPIKLSSTSTGAGSWYGLMLLPTAAGSLLDYVVLERATYGLWYEATAPNTLRHLTATGNQYGVQVAAGTAVLDGAAVVQNTATGVQLAGAGSVTMTNARLVANSSYGINAGSTGTTLLTNVTIHGHSSYGIYASVSGHTLTVKNSIVTNNGSYGIYKSAAPNATVTYTDIWGQSTATSGSVTLGAGCLSQNPNYVSATSPWDLRLSTGSVAIDSADPGGAPDSDIDGAARPLDGDGANGAAFDMGAHEFVRGAACGDGVVQLGEQCDDGNRNGTYGFCKIDCSSRGPRCGDGATNGPAGAEECDDGNLNEGDGCLRTCKSARCGDGVVRVGVEQCDDGNTADGDGCSAQCKLPTCGDGKVDAFEVCDDANENNADACLTSCTPAFCGDGFVRTGVEQCDDGNNLSGDGCSATCKKEGAPPGGSDGGAGGDAGPLDGGAGDAGTSGPAADPGEGDGGCSTGGGRGSANAPAWALVGAGLALALAAARRRARRGRR